MQLLQLPEDLLVELLLKLPVESLIALRIVCKRFARSCLNTYISSKQFTRTHLERWRNHDFETKNVFIRFPEDGLDPASKGKRTSTEFAKAALKSTRPGSCRFLLEEASFKQGSLHFGGCHDGILCLYEFRTEHMDIVIYICNPALNQCKVISRRMQEHRYNTKVCLVPCLDDYKVVVVLLPTPVGVIGHVRSNVYIYSLNDCCWRYITAKSTDTYNYSPQYPISILDLVVHNQCIHWMIRLQDFNTNRPARYTNVFKVLDLRRGSVREIILPRYLRKHTATHLIRYQGRLAALLWHEDESFELCVVEEGGGDGHGINWGEPDYVDVNVHHCSRPCKMESGPTSWGHLQRSDEEDNVYLTATNFPDNSRPHKFLIPEGVEIRSCITADYVPSLVSVLSQHTA